MASYYKHSGEFSPQGAIAGFLAGALIAAPSAFLYNYGIVSLPYAKLRAICTMAFGALIGTACGFALCWGKVRSKQVAIVVGSSASLFGLYVSWIGWLMHLRQPSLWVFNVSRAALHPQRVWKAMLIVNSIGTWSFGRGEATTGTMLWLVWVAEAVLVLLLGIGVTIGIVEWRPFCERCKEWCKERHTLLFEPTVQPPDFRNLVESGNLAELAKLPAGSVRKPHYQVHLHTCAGCRSLSTVTVAQQLPKNRQIIVKKMLVTPDQASVVRDLAVARSAKVGTAPVGALAK